MSNNSQVIWLSSWQRHSVLSVCSRTTLLKLRIYNLPSEGDTIKSCHRPIQTLIPSPPWTFLDPDPASNQTQELLQRRAALSHYNSSVDPEHNIIDNIWLLLSHDENKWLLFLTETLWDSCLIHLASLYLLAWSTSSWLKKKILTDLWSACAGLAWLSCCFYLADVSHLAVCWCQDDIYLDVDMIHTCKKVNSLSQWLSHGSNGCNIIPQGISDSMSVSRLFTRPLPKP